MTASKGSNWACAEFLLDPTLTYTLYFIYLPTLILSTEVYFRANTSYLSEDSPPLVPQVLNTMNN